MSIIFLFNYDTTSELVFCEEITKKYTKSGSLTIALFAENNFVTADNLSEMIKNNLTATDYKLETKNFENLMQEKLITFSTK